MPRKLLVRFGRPQLCTPVGLFLATGYMSGVVTDFVPNPYNFYDFFFVFR